jgi:hypothetical protein
LFQWLRAFSEYVFGTIGYAAPALILWALAVRPSRTGLRDTMLPGDPHRRLAAWLFWLPILTPIAAAVVTRTNMVSLWNTPALNLLPVLLLASPKLTLPRTMLVRIAGTAIAFTIIALLAAPFVAGTILKVGVENHAAYGRLVAAEMDRQWKQVTQAPLKLVGGPFGLISTAAVYGADQPSTFADFSPYLSPWATPERIARQGMVIACPSDDAGCLAQVEQRMRQTPGSTKSEVELRRRWLAWESAPARFVIAVLPPRS